MEVTKFGHCCLLIEEGGARILTDPGGYSAGHEALTGLHAVLVTHEHADHLHIPSLKELLRNNPEAAVLTNNGVGALLAKEGIAHRVLASGEKTEVGETSVEALDGAHEEIFESVGQVQNTGFFVGERLFYPGDSYRDPERPVEVLALPVAGPWCKISDAIRYALRVAPRVAFPVHDGALMEERIGANHAIPEKILGEHGISFVRLGEGDSYDI